jgi:hypothetical protein
MAVLAPMTDLEAVNRMLGSIGQAPVNTLDVPGSATWLTPRAHLNEALRDVQTVGYAFNTDYGFALTRDAITGFILIPDGALDVDASDSSVNAVERTLPTTGQRALYDTDNHTFVFTDDITADVIWGFGFNDIPQAARSYIATAAARRFQAQKVNSPILDRYDAEDEELAFLLLQRYERRTRDTNSFRRSPSLQKWTGRRSF